jgi:uncharacterized cupin superfamily protein
MPVPEAPLSDEKGGLTPAGPGWFIVNVGEALALHHETAGSYVRFDNREFPFEEIGFNVHVLQPGEPNAKYHGEGVQEGFLVVHGECTLIVEGEERTMRAWDFAHFPPMTRHVAIGAGEGPCAIVMFGGRKPEIPLEYPESELAARYGAAAPEPTDNGADAYRDWSSDFRSGRLDWPL